MDDFQRLMWHQMLDEIRAFESGTLSLAKLVDDLRGLFVEADPHDGQVRDGFGSLFSVIEVEYELRTEGWGNKPGVGIDADLRGSLRDLEEWVTGLLTTVDPTHS